MNGLDYLILGILGVSAVVSLFRGFVAEVLSLVLWIGSFWLASRLAPGVAALLVDVVASPAAQLAFAYVMLLLVFGACTGLLVWLVRRFVLATGLGPTDRSLGLVFGAARGVVIVVALVVLGRMTAMPQDPAWQASTLVPHFDRLAQHALSVLPEGLRERLDPLATTATLAAALGTAGATPTSAAPVSVERPAATAAPTARPASVSSPSSQPVSAARR